MPHPPLTTLLASSLFALALARNAAAEGVLIVDGSGGVSHASIQAAVDAAVDGDLIVIGAGSYAGFVIQGKALSVQALTGHAVEVEGTIEVRDLPAGKAVVLCGLSATGAPLPYASDPALRVADCLGFVRVQDCSLNGGAGVRVCDDGDKFSGPGGVGAMVTSSLRVSFTSSRLRGGVGGGEQTSGCVACYAGDGGHALSAIDSAIAVYDCALDGGAGGDDGASGGHGGDGVRIVGYGLFASGSDFRGGDGGDACDFIGPIAGDGGNGLTVDGAQARLLDNTFDGGAAGEAPIGTDGEPGLPTSGAPLFYLPGSSRHTYGPAMTSDASAASLGVRGASGDFVYLLTSDDPTFLFEPAASGMQLVPRAALEGLRPLGVVPAGGFLPLELKLPALASGAAHRRLFVQALTRDASGAYFLASSLELAILRRGSAPDCDGDGVNDLVALVEGLAPDCQGNLVPDSCDLAGGASPDCNANGVPDECDLAFSTSLDVDEDGQPDECQGSFATWHVDAGAAPGGDGSAAAPFQNLTQGVSAASDGDTVLVADGLYTGAGNRNVGLGGRAITIRSANGPAGCVIDCQQAGRAFWLTGDSRPHVGIEGFTIRNGSSSSSGGAIEVEVFLHGRLTIADCIFEDCGATNFGGALRLDYVDARVLDCIFRGNHASYGGALASTDGAPVILRCSFEDNTAAQEGGAVYMTGVHDEPGALVSLCSFLDNHAVAGGALSYRNGNLFSILESPLRIDQCLFAGNGAARGGALSSNGIANFGLTELWISACTLVSNTASDRGGALAMIGSQAWLADSILWDNSATSGPAIDLQQDAAELSVRFCDLEGGAASIAPGTGTVWIGPGMLAVDPAFVDPDGADDDALTFGDNDYHLSPLSPCIDAAETASIGPDHLDLDQDGATAEAAALELDGGPRRVDRVDAQDAGAGAPPLADLGAYERQ